MSPAVNPPCDTCGKKLTNAYPAPGLSERQRRFLDAYRDRATIAPAARLARVHRATVYRWLEDPAFAAAARAAAELYFLERPEKALADEEARRQWRRQRELERRPMRCFFLARAREAKRRGRGKNSPNSAMGDLSKYGR